MKFAALETLDRIAAAGVLARAALSLEENGNPAASPKLENEAELRAALLAEAYNALGLGHSPDMTDDLIERVSDYLDLEADRITGKVDSSAAFDRMITRGDFPSDLYEIEIIPNIQKNLGKLYDKERLLIEQTVRLPTEEQHFGPPTTPNDPYLISLFARRFRTRFPHKDFTMLVAGQRGDGRKLHVHQAWRLYDSLVDTRSACDLVESLRRFSDVFGSEITLGDQKGHFFLTSVEVPALKIKVNMGRRNHTVTVTHFTQTDPVTKHPRAALVVAIDVNRYVATIKKMDADIIETPRSFERPIETKTNSTQ